MIRLLQISDPHFGTEKPKVLEAAIELARTQSPDLIILSGDITQRARRSQFDQAHRFTRQLQKPVLAVPGNHDIPLFNLYARLFNPYGNYQSVFGQTLEPEFENSQLLVIGVNTTRPSLHKNGKVSTEQIIRVAMRLSEAKPEQFRVVVEHHPVRAIEASDTVNLLIGREQAIPTWVDAGMDIILGGHIHLPYVLPLYGRRGIAGRKAWTVQAGTAVSKRVRGKVPNSINLIHYRPVKGKPQCVVEQWDYAGESQAFLSVKSTALTLSREH